MIQRLVLTTVCLFILSAAAGFAEASTQRAAISVKASGEAGDRGQNGSDADQNRPQNPPEHGRRLEAAPGGNGQRGDAGGNAGSIEVKVAEEGDFVRVEGAIRWREGSPTTIREQVDARQIGTIYLYADGGEGGAGGAAGKGQPGANGLAGDPARFSDNGEVVVPPTDGQRGFAGGDAGTPGAGGRGGDGGSIRVELNSQDLHLAPLLQASFQGGKAGEVGPALRSVSELAEGGVGGQPGKNIDSKKVRFRVEGEVVHEADVPLKDIGFYYEFPVPNQEPMKEWIPARALDGRPGQPGPHGRPSQIPSSESPGRIGSYVIEVRDGSGQIHPYNSPWKLELVEAAVVSASGESFLEPGEKGYLRVQLKNSGEMPSPYGGKILLRLFNTTGVENAQTTFELPSLSHNQTLTIDRELSFSAAKADPTRSISSDRFGTTAVVNVATEIPSLAMTSVLKSAPVQMSVTYPVEIRPIDAPQAIRPGEAYKVLAKVQLVGKNPINPGREIATQWNAAIAGLGGDHSRLVFKSHSAGDQVIHPLTPEGWVELVKNLQPGVDTYVELQVGVPAENQNSGAVRFDEILSLAPQEAAARLNIQRRRTETRVIGAFQPRQDADLLLVVNRNLDLDQIAAARGEIEALGMKVDVLDLSIDSSLSLFQSQNALAELYRGKSIVILTGGERLSNMGDLSEFFRAMVSKDVSFVTTGTSVGPQQVEDSLRPDVFAPDAAPTKGKIKEVRESFLKRVSAAKEAERAIRLTVLDSYTFGSPSAEHLTKAALALQADLMREFPDRRFLIVKTFVGTKESGGFFSSSYNVGHLDLIETTDAKSGSFVATRILDRQGLDTRVLLTAILRVQDKAVLQRLLNKIAHQASAADAQKFGALLADTLAARVGEELRSIVQAESPRIDLPLFHDLQSFNFSEGKNAGILETQALEMYTQVLAMSQGLGRQLRNQMATDIEEWVKHLNPSKGTANWSQVQAEARRNNAGDFVQTYSNLRRGWSGGGNWFADFDALTADSRIEEGDAVSQRARSRATDRSTRQQNAGESERIRQQLLIPGGCAGLLGQVAAVTAQKT